MWGDTSLCFWFTFPCLVMLIIFSSVCWSSVCCLWKNVYSGPLPIFFFFDVEFHESFIYFGYSVQFSHSVVSDSLRPHEVQHTRLPCPSPTPRVYSNPCPLSRWRHPTISSSVVPCSSCLQSSPASGSFPMTQFFASGGQSIGVSASTSVLPMNIQDWFPLGWTGWIFLFDLTVMSFEVYMTNRIVPREGTYFSYKSR